MRQVLDYRLPVTELHVVAAVLDPSQRNLNALQEYLSERGMTAVDLRSRTLQHYMYVGDSAVSLTVNNPQTTDDGKKAKQELLSKHIVSAPSGSREIQQFRCLSVARDNILTWWESQQQGYPMLAKLARVVLATPATSAPSEDFFLSLAGLTINARRSSLAPSSVYKVIFVHENVSLINV